jgi:hypothetical protein
MYVIAASFARALWMCLSRPCAVFLLICQQVRAIYKTRNPLICSQPVNYPRPAGMCPGVQATACTANLQVFYREKSGNGGPGSVCLESLCGRRTGGHAWRTPHGTRGRRSNTEGAPSNRAVLCGGRMVASHRNPWGARRHDPGPAYGLRTRDVCPMLLVDWETGDACAQATGVAERLARRLGMSPCSGTSVQVRSGGYRHDVLDREHGVGHPSSACPKAMCRTAFHPSMRGAAGRRCGDRIGHS